MVFTLYWSTYGVIIVNNSQYPEHTINDQINIEIDKKHKKLNGKQRVTITTNK
jgi:hypothetical protein